jgi:putative addiction module killer protein
MVDEVNQVHETGEAWAWLARLKDIRAQGYLLIRLQRAREGNFGRVESVGGGVYEMKHSAGPGYRLYFHQVGPAEYQVLCGGDKSSQVEDVKYAKALKAAMEREHER